MIISRGYGVKWRGELVAPAYLGLAPEGANLTLEFASGTIGRALVEDRDGQAPRYTFRGSSPTPKGSERGSL